MKYEMSRPERSQLQMFTSIEDMVAPDNSVRLINLFLDRFAEACPKMFEDDKPQTTGRKPYPREDLCKLYLYGYLNRISSSRRLEAEAHRNLEVMFLLSNLRPDHKTIANFRKDNVKLIRLVCLSFRKFLKDEGYIYGQKIAFDGTKVKACTASDKVITLTKLDKRLEREEKKLDEYLARLQANDSREEVEQALDAADAAQAGAPEHLAAVEGKIAELKAKIAEMKALKKEMVASGKNSYCPNDPDASLMKTRDGSKPSYNVQAGVDAANKMIVMADVTDSCNDINELEPDCERLHVQLGIVPEIIEADKGYGNIAQIKSIEKGEDKKECEQKEEIEEKASVCCAIPLAERASAKKDREAGVSFTCEPEKKTCNLLARPRLKAPPVRHG